MTFFVPEARNMSGSLNQSHPSGPGSFSISVSAPAEPETPPPPQPPGITLRRPRPCRPIDFSALCPGESVTDVEFLTGDGNAFVIFPSCLVSPRWTRSCIAAAVAELLGLRIDVFRGEHVQYFATPRGRIPMRRYVVLWFRPVCLTEYFSLMILPVLETETHGALGVSMVIGEPHIRNVLEVPLTLYVPPQRVENHEASDMPWSAGALDHQTVQEWLTDNYGF